jgi:hypothetical protein
MTRSGMKIAAVHITAQKRWSAADSSILGGKTMPCGERQRQTRAASSNCERLKATGVDDVDYTSWPFEPPLFLG